MARLDAAFQVIVRALAMLAGAILAAIALAIPVDVTLRACCTGAIFGLGDLIEHGMAAATFLGAPWVLTANAHVSVDIVTSSLPGPARRRLDTLVNLVGAAVSAVFFLYMLRALVTALERGSMVRGIIVVPEWATFAAPALCALLLALDFLLRIGRETGPSSAPGI